MTVYYGKTESLKAKIGPFATDNFPFAIVDMTGDKVTWSEGFSEEETMQTAIKLIDKPKYRKYRKVVKV